VNAVAEVVVAPLPSLPKAAPEPVAEPEIPGLVTAPSGKRLFARLIDVVLYGACGTAGIVGGGVVEHFFGSAVGEAMGAGMWIGLLCVWIPQIVLISRTGQSLGKRVAGIRIVRTDGKPAGFVQGWLVRSFVFVFVDFFLFLLMLVPYLIFLTVNLCMLGTTHRRTVQDRVAGTRVVLG